MGKKVNVNNNVDIDIDAIFSKSLELSNRPIVQNNTDSDTPTNTVGDAITYAPEKSTKRDYSNSPYLKSLGDYGTDIVTFDDVTDVEDYHKYGVPVNRSRTYNEDRANAQSSGEQAINMVKQMGTTIAGEAISGFGSIQSIVQDIVREAQGGNAEFNNMLMTLGEEIQGFGRENAEIYRQNPNSSFDIKDPAWWFENGVSVASSFGLMIPGIAVASAVSKGVGALGKLGKLANAANRISKIAKGSSKASRVANRGEFLTKTISSAVVMRNAENLKESMHVANQIRNEALQLSDEQLNEIKNNDELKRQFHNATNKEFNRENYADYVAARAGWRNYAVDAGNVIFDMLQVAPLFKGLKTATRTKFNPAKIINTERQAVGKAVLSPRKAALHNLAYYGAGIGGGEVLTEGIEEAVNYIASEEGIHYGRELLNKKDDTNFVDRWNRYKRNPQMWEQAFWGAIGGGVFSGGTRAIHSLENVIKDTNDSHSTENRIKESTNRQLQIGILIGQIKQLKNNIDPFTQDNEGNQAPITSDEQRKNIEDAIINKAGTELGISASKVGNVNLLLNQLKNKDFRAKMAETLNNTKQEAAEEGDTSYSVISDDMSIDTGVDDIMNRLADKVKYGENLYKQYYTNIFSRKNIPDHLKGLIVEQGVLLDQELDEHRKAKSEIDGKISTTLNSTVYDSIRDSISDENDTSVSFDNSLKKSALQIAKEEVKSIINKAKKQGNEYIANRYTSVLNRINEDLSELNNNLGYKTLINKGVEESLIKDKSESLSREYIIEGIATDINDIVSNTKEYADKIDKEFEEVATDISDRTTKEFEDEFTDDASTEDLIELRDKVSKAVRNTSNAPKISRELYKLYKKINKRISNRAKQEKRKASKSKLRVKIGEIVDVLKNDARTIKEGVEEILNDDTAFEEEEIPTTEATEATDETIEGEEDNISQPIDLEIDDTGSEPESEQEDASSPTGLQEDDSNEIPTDDTTEQDEHREGKEEVDEIEETVEEDTSESEENDEDRVEDTEEIVEEDDIVDNDLQYDSPLGSMSLFISSIYSMNINRLLDNSTNNNVILTAEQTEQFKAIIDGIDVGNNIFIKYDPSDTTNKGLNRALGIYNEQGKLLFHLPTMANDGNINYMELRGVRYTAGTSWVKYLIDQLQQGKNLDIISKLIEYKNATINDVDKANKLKQELIDSNILDIININRSNDLLKIKDDAFDAALKHIATVVSQDNETLRSPDASISGIIDSLTNWSNKISSDIIHNLNIRTHLINNPTTVLSSEIVSKNKGATMKGSYQMLNEVFGETSDNTNVPIMLTQQYNPNKVEQGNTTNVEDIPSGLVNEPYSAMPYLPMYVGSLDGEKGQYRYVKGQYTHLNMDNIPEQAQEYNNKLIQYISDSIKNSDNINELFDKLKDYVYIDKPISFTNKDNTTTSLMSIHTIEKIKEKRTNGETVLVDKLIKIRETDGKLSVNLHRGHKALNELDIQRNLKLAKRSMRIVQTNNGNNRRLPEGEFTDFTGKTYDSYSQFITESGAVVTNYGVIRDDNGKIVSHVTAFATNAYSNDMEIRIKGDATIYSQKPRKREKYLSVLDYANSIGNHQYSTLFSALDSLGINFDSSVRAEQEGDRIASFNKSTKTLRLYPKFDNINSNTSKILQLAHESIHGMIGTNITKEHKSQLTNIDSIVRERFKDAKFQENFTADEIRIINEVLNETAKQIEEVITYGLTNKAFAKALNLIESKSTEPKSLARELLDVILNIIDSIYGSTLLTDVSSIFENIITPDNTNINDTGTNNNDNLSDDSDITGLSDLIDDMASTVSESGISQVPSAIGYMRDLNKEDRAIVRDRINDGTLIFKCK